jgi:hypothetical protein
MSSLRLRNTQAREQSLDTNLQVPSMEFIGIDRDCDDAIKKCKKKTVCIGKNIQQRGFASGHPPDY